MVVVLLGQFSSYLRNEKTLKQYHSKALQIGVGGHGKFIVVKITFG